jgi:hypothetical protein
MQQLKHGRGTAADLLEAASAKYPTNVNIYIWLSAYNIIHKLYQLHCVQAKVAPYCFYKYLQHLKSDLLNILYTVTAANLT